jgi:indolepyruvate ferredoxin oxidoreductase alpha subunit
VEQVWMVNPFKYKESLAATKAALDSKGLRVIISQAPCYLYEARVTGKKRRARFQVKDECGNCRHCLDYFGCPAMSLKPDSGRTQMIIDHDLCSGCAFCVQFCECIRPVKAEG